MVLSPQALGRLRSFIYANAQRIARGFGIAALIVFADGFWANAFDNGVVKSLLIFFSALAVAFFATTRSGVGEQVLAAAWASLVWSLTLILLGCALTLAKSGRFDEGGPFGLALVFGFYFGLPITAVAMVTTPLLGHLTKDRH